MALELDSVLVTGANRGIGLEFVRQLVKLPIPPRFVFATYRSVDTLKELQDIKESSKQSQVILVKMDVTKAEEIAEARKIVEEFVGDSGLNLLINNAGIAKWLSFPDLTAEIMQSIFAVNAMGPVLIVQEMLPLLERAAVNKESIPEMKVSKAAVLNISSACGSISRTGTENLIDLGIPAYKMSKAALNMGMRVIAENIREKNILVVNMCPGWVKTDMGSEQADLKPEESISAMLQTMQTLNVSHHGTFMDRLGNSIPF